jgi:hypothetical protein
VFPQFASVVVVVVLVQAVPEVVVAAVAVWGIKIVYP